MPLQVLNETIQPAKSMATRFPCSSFKSIISPHPLTTVHNVFIPIFLVLYKSNNLDHFRTLYFENIFVDICNRGTRFATHFVVIYIQKVPN